MNLVNSKIKSKENKNSLKVLKKSSKCLRNLKGKMSI